ncbi:sulfurtransferase [Luethyella okanaganae]|uniref:Sulfurtransferase n=1 Tax=Luethyella okanaganae TaxID=69372 RepID=A0ABW1VKY6_9MICO
MSSLALPSPLISTQWLADHLGSDGLVVLDATVLSVQAPGGGHRWLSGYNQYLITGHIPGSVFADVLEVFSDPNGSFDFARPDAQQIAAAAASIGIGDDSTVVVYDASVGQWASRIWWLLRSFGFERVAVLDGGLAKWNSEGRTLDTGHVEPRPTGPFTAVEQPGFWVDKAFVASVVTGETDAVLVCALPPSDFSGETGSRPRRGHIPGSVNVPAGRLVDRGSNAYLRGEALSERLAPAFEAAGTADGDGAEILIVVYCGGGIAAASGALALTIAGHRNVAVYDGSLNEWSADEAAPLASTAA